MNIHRLLYKIKRELQNKLGIQLMHRSETGKVRKLVLPYCTGKGCDIGFGGDKIKKENCDGIDYATPYVKAGSDKVDIPCDVINEEIPVADSTYDYVYSSHLIEDFKDTTGGLRKFIRILKNGGTLILVFPDQVKFEEVCNRTGQPLNPYHVHKDMSLGFMLDRLKEVENISFDILYQSDRKIDYNVILVLKIHKQTA